MKKSPAQRPAVRAIPRSLGILTAGLGLLLGVFAARAQAQNLIVNGGFETGNFNGWLAVPAASGSYFGAGSATSYFIVDPSSINSGLFGPPGVVPPHTGNYAVFFGAEGPQFDELSQAIHTVSKPLLKGVYRISFWLSSQPSAFTPPSQFQAVWNGHTIYNTVNTPTTPYQQFVFNEVATSKSSTLGFQVFRPPGEYFLDDVSVTLVGLEQGSFSQFAQARNLTPNESSVARALDSAASNPKSGRLLAYLDYRPLTELPADFDRISPAELTSIFTISTSYAQQQSLNLQRRTDDIRSGSSGFSAANLAINGDNPSYSGAFGLAPGVAGPSGNDGKDVKETKEVAPAENRWGAFLSGTGEWVNVSGTDNARGYDLASGGFTLGVDYKVCPNFAIGLAAGYTGTTADLTDHGRVWVNGGKLGLYTTTFAGGWYADAAAFGGYNSYDTRRSSLQGDARGSTDGGEVDALFGTGYDFKAGGLTFGPTATFNYTYAGTNAFTENGSLTPLSIHGGNADSLRTAFGVKLSYDCKCGGIRIKPELRAAWQHEFGDTTYDLDSSFANGTGGTFTAAGPKLGRDSALVGAGFAIQFTERCSTYLYYDGELGRSHYESNSVTGGVRVAF